MVEMIDGELGLLGEWISWRLGSDTTRSSTTAPWSPGEVLVLYLSRGAVLHGTERERLDLVARWMAVRHTRGVYRLVMALQLPGWSPFGRAQARGSPGTAVPRTGPLE